MEELEADDARGERDRLAAGNNARYRRGHRAEPERVDPLNCNRGGPVDLPRSSPINRSEPVLARANRLHAVLSMSYCGLHEESDGRHRVSPAHRIYSHRS